MRSYAGWTRVLRWGLLLAAAFCLAGRVRRADRLVVPITVRSGDKFAFGYDMFNAFDVDGYGDGSLRVFMGGAEFVTDPMWRVKHVFVDGREVKAVNLEVTVFPKRAVRLADR